MSNLSMHSALTKLTECCCCLQLSQNKFSGTLPSLSSLLNAEIVVLFDNKFRGHVDLPVKQQLQAVLIQNNQLSCHINANTSVDVPQKNSLVLPGNAFSDPLPAWVPSR